MDHLNSVITVIEFRMEDADKGTPSFLDILVMKSCPKLHTIPYRKSTCINSYLRIKSDHSRLYLDQSSQGHMSGSEGFQQEVKEY
jgi:hypothetical protein